MASGILIKPAKFLVDLIVTLVLGIYFVFFFLLGYWAVFLTAFFSKNRESRFQAAVHYYLKILFFLMRILVPGLRIQPAGLEMIANSKPSIIVVNHVSFLDPILVISQVKRAMSISKQDYFRIPVFGWIVKNSGHIPATIEAKDAFWADMMVQSIQKALGQGSHFFIFPEGTRSLTGQLGRFKKGAFYFAKEVEAPITMLFIRNTNRLYPPGSILLNTCRKITLSIEYLGEIPEEEVKKARSATELRDQAQARFMEYENAKKNKE